MCTDVEFDIFSNSIVRSVAFCISRPSKLLFPIFFERSSHNELRNMVRIFLQDKCGDLVKTGWLKKNMDRCGFKNTKVYTDFTKRFSETELTRFLGQIRTVYKAAGRSARTRRLHTNRQRRSTPSWTGSTKTPVSEYLHEITFVTIKYF